MEDFDFGLCDADYFTVRKAPKEAVRKLWALDRHVVKIGAPRFVALEQRHKLPLLVVRTGPNRELYKFRFTDHAMISVVDLDKNSVYFGPVFTEADVESKAPLDPANIPEGGGSENYVTDLREELGVAWHPATLLATVLTRDMVSNRVRIELGKSPGAYHDKEVERFLASEHERATPIAVSPAAGKNLPSYAKISGSPEIPAEFGVALATTRVVVAKQGWTSILRGAFRLRVREHERVKVPVVEGTGREESPTAVIGITLVVTGSDLAEASILRLDVPSWDPLAPKDPVATGYFALDLRAQNLVGTRPQTRFVYALSGEHLTGPVPTALVSEAMLPSSH
jgi:hypothetical protein